MSNAQYGDYQFEIYFNGLENRVPKYPVDTSSFERAAAEVLPSFVYSYVAGGCGDERTQRANVEAFCDYAIVPCMLVGATERDLSVSLFDMKLPTLLLMCPIGVIGLCAQDFHGDIQVAKASARTRVPMVASTSHKTAWNTWSRTPKCSSSTGPTTKTSPPASCLAPSGRDIGLSW